MTYNPDLPARRSPRLQGYDYSQNGAYFVTICTQRRVCLFGEVFDTVMQYNDAGMMIAHWWEELGKKFPQIDLDASIVMPNHVHGIIMLGEDIAKPTSLPKIIQWFKTMTTNHYIRGVNQAGWESFEGQLWQRSYYDHIIRNERDLNRIRDYIQNNPARWEDDTNHPQNTGRL